MLLRSIAEYAVAERERALPPDVIHHAKRVLIDWFSAVLPGGLEPPAPLLVAALADELGRGGARLFPSGATAAPRAAALINGSAAHTVEFDDIFRDALYHPGAPVVAAALALAQHRGATGRELLLGIILGYEISTRIGVAVSPAHYEYWHTTGTVGTLGAAAAAAGVLGLGVEPTMHALANAGTFAAGLQQAFRSDAMSKPLHAGRAAEAGVLAALAAERGVTGAPDILEGRRGFGHAMGGIGDWTPALDGLGKRYNVTQMTVKNHGCCGHTFAAIDAVVALRNAHAVAPEDIERVCIDTYATAVEVTGRTQVATAFDGKFSLPYVVSNALVHGSVRLDAFAPERLNDPRTRALMARVELRVDAGLDAAYPNKRGARVTLWLRDGRRLDHLQPTRKGDPDAPLTDDELIAKYRELAEPVLGAPSAAALLDELWAIDSAPAVELATAAGAGSARAEVRV